MACITRRDFIKSSVTIGVAAGVGSTVTVSAQQKSATDWVTLGNSGIKVTRLAFGTGTFSGKVQRELGQDGFTRLVRYAYDHGIRFFESADSYGEMHEMLAKALKGIPRDSYKLMTKIPWGGEVDVPSTIDRYRRETDSEYFDILLMHCLRTADWPSELQKLQDDLSEAKEKQAILSHGASCHGMLPLRAFPGNNWLDVALVRINHNGALMDKVNMRSREPGDVDEVVSHINSIHQQGTGVIGMKLIGEGRFTQPEDREASIKFVMQMGTVDSITIGFKNTAEIDEAIERINRSLA
jgi:predicted aldo/keto reductase-like oxidoreductase